jgi:hypothetical protein
MTAVIFDSFRMVFRDQITIFKKVTVPYLFLQFIRVESSVTDPRIRTLALT